MKKNKKTSCIQVENELYSSSMKKIVTKKIDIRFLGHSVTEILEIRRHLEKEQCGISLKPSDAARWAVSKVADEIRTKKQKG